MKEDALVGVHFTIPASLLRPIPIVFLYACPQRYAWPMAASGLKVKWTYAKEMTFRCARWPSSDLQRHERG
jgi:hypothetical protein